MLLIVPQLSTQLKHAHSPIDQHRAMPPAPPSESQLPFPWESSSSRKDQAQRLLQRVAATVRGR